MSNSPSGPDLDALLKHGRWVRALAHSLMADSAAAEDVEQKTWLAAIERPPSKATNPRAWLGSVVRNFAGMHWREQKARRRREHVVGESKWADSFSETEFMQPDCLADRMDTVRKLAGALAELDEPYGTTLYLRFFEELTIREIAKRMGAPQSTAHARIHRGLELLRSELTTTLGKDWRNRCLVFTVPLTQAAKLGGLTTVLAMTLKTKVLMGAAALAIVSLIAFEPWATTDDKLEATPQDFAALEAPGSNENANAKEYTASIQRTPLAFGTKADEAGPVGTNVDFPFIALVRDQETLKPIANAEVFFLDHASEFSEEVLVTTKEEGLDLEQKLERFGTRHTTDQAGMVHLPLPVGQIEIGARTNNKFAYFQQYANASKSNLFAELLLRTPLTQRVIVVDEAGIPVAGVTVACGQSMSINRVLVYPIRLETDEDGIAEFRHLESYLRQSATSGCSFGLLVPSAIPQYKVESGDTIGQETIRFTLPATGEVQIECLDNKGRPMKDGTHVVLQLDSPRQTNLGDVTTGEQDSWVKEGVAIFPRVGINTNLVASTYSSRLRKEVTVSSLGPSRQGEVTRLQIILPPESPMIAVHVLDSHARPFQKSQIDGMLDFYDSLEQRQPEHLLETSDTNGRITLPVDEIVNAGAQAARLFLHPRETPENAGDLPFTILNLDLNTLLEQEDPIQAVLGESLIVAGIVVDQTGHPSAGRKLHLLVNDPKNARSSQGPVIYRMRISTDQNGRFRFSGPTTHGLLSYSLQMNWNEIIPFVVGQDDLVIPMPAQVDISGRVLLDNLEWLHELSIKVVPLESDKEDLRILKSSSLEYPNGRFQLKDINPDEVQIQLKQFKGLPFIANLTPSEMTIESSVDGLHLQDWDLRGKIFRHAINFTAATNTAPNPTPVTLLSEYGKAEFYWRPGKPFILYASQPTLDFEVLADGYRPQNGHSNGEASVVLQSGIPIRLALPSEVPFPIDSLWRLTITNREDGSEYRNQEIRYHMGNWPEEYPPFGIAHAGSWNISMSFFMFTHWNMVPAIARPLVSFENGSTTFAIEVKESDAEQSFTIPVTTEALEDALPATK